jgi:outer membrane protein OmpA-like peptidoglycan-associated protein
MAVDLLSQMKSFWTSEAIQQLSVMLGEQPDRVGQTLSLGAPAILAGMLKSATGTTNAHRLVDLVKNEPEEMAKFGGMSGFVHHLAGLGDVVGLDPLVKYGRSALRTIFGDKLDAVLDLIATDSGAKPSSVATLMSLLVPTMMGKIRQETAARGLTGDSLRNLLTSQRDAIAAAAPGGLARTLGLRSFADLGGPAEPVRAPTSGPVAAPGVSVHSTTVHRTMPTNSNPSPARWAIPLAIGLLALTAGYYLLAPTTKPKPEVGPVETAETKSRPVEPARTTKPAPAEIAHAELPAPAPTTTAEGRPIVETGVRRIPMVLPGDKTIEVPEGSYLEAAIKMLRDGTVKAPQMFAADGLMFNQDSKLTTDSVHSAEHLATIAKAYPKAKIKVEAREKPGVVADEKERQATAQKRADAVRDVLVQAGVPGERVTAEVRLDDPLDAVTRTKKADVYLLITPE